MRANASSGSVDTLLSVPGCVPSRGHTAHVVDWPRRIPTNLRVSDRGAGTRRAACSLLSTPTAIRAAALFGPWMGRAVVSWADEDEDPSGHIT